MVSFVLKPNRTRVVFPYASKITLNGFVRDMSIDAAVDGILAHTVPVYTFDEVERIAKALAYVLSQFSDAYDTHINNVRNYIDSN